MWVLRVSRCISGPYKDCYPFIPVVISHRTLLDFNNFAKEAGLVGKADIPIIDDKIAKTDQLLETPISTVVNKIVDENEHKNELIQYIVPYMPELDPSTAWAYIVGSAVVLRTAFCCYNRLSLNRNLQMALPYSAWFHERNLEYSLWKDKRDIVKMREVSNSVSQFTSENNLRGTASWARRRFIIRAMAMFGFNCCGLKFLSLVYEPQLASAPFLWVPSLLGHDHLFVLPAMNALLSLCIWQVSMRNLAAPDKARNSGIDLRRLALKSATLCVVMYLSFSTLAPLSVHFQSLYFLFWTASNLAGLLTASLIAESDSMRVKLGLLPKRKYLDLLEDEKALTPKIKTNFDDTMKI